MSANPTDIASIESQYGMRPAATWTNVPADAPINQYIRATDPYYIVQQMPPEQQQQYVSLLQQRDSWNAAHPAATNNNSNRPDDKGGVNPVDAKLSAMYSGYVPQWAQTIQKNMGSTNMTDGALNVDPKTGGFTTYDSSSGWDKFMNTAIPLATTLMGGAAFGPATWGALSGAGNATVNGGNVLTGALKGEVMGELGGQLAPIGNAVGNAVGGGALGSLASGATTGAIQGGVGAAFNGGNIGQGALSGGISGGVGGGLKGYEASTGALDVLGQPAINAINSGIGGGLSSALHGGNAANGAIMGAGSSLLGYGAGQIGNAVSNGIGGLMANNSSPGGLSDSAPATNNALPQANFSSSMPTSADFQNPNIDLSGIAPGPLSLSGNNMATDYSNLFDTSSMFPTDTQTPAYDPNVGPTLSQSTDPYINGTNAFDWNNILAPPDALGQNAIDTLSSPAAMQLPSVSSGSPSGGTGGSWINKFLGQIGIGSGAGKNSLSPLQQIAGLAGLTGVIGSALGGSNTNQTPNYQSIPGSAAASYGNGAGGGSNFNWTNYGYQPRVQNPAMQNPNIDWSHYGEQSQAQKPGGGVFFTPQSGAPVNAAFGPSQQQPVAHAHGGGVQRFAMGGGVGPLDQLAQMAPQVAMQNHVSNMNPPQPVMGPQPGQMQTGGDDSQQNGPPQMGVPYGDNLRGVRPPPQLRGTDGVQPGQMMSQPPRQPFQGFGHQMGGMDRGDRFNGDAFSGHPMFNGMGQHQLAPGVLNKAPPMAQAQPLQGAMGLNPGAMPMQPGLFGGAPSSGPTQQSGSDFHYDPNQQQQWQQQQQPASGGAQSGLASLLNPLGGGPPPPPSMGTGDFDPKFLSAEQAMGTQNENAQPYTGPIGAGAGMADGGSTGSEAGYTGLPADGGNSYWQAVKDRIGEIVGSHHVGTGAADQAAQKIQGRGKQIDDAVAANDHAQGGEIMSPLQHFAGHGYVQGPGDGQSDDIPAKLSNGEYVISADVVSALGNGSNEVGANKLDGMMQNVRKSVAKNHAKGKLQPKTKDPHAYLGKG